MVGSQAVCVFGAAEALRCWMPSLPRIRMRRISVLSFSHSLSLSCSTPPASSASHTHINSFYPMPWGVLQISLCLLWHQLASRAVTLHQQAGSGVSCCYWRGSRMVVCLVVVGGCLSLTAAYYPVVCQPSVATELSAAACSRVCVCLWRAHAHTLQHASGFCVWFKCNWSHAGWRLVMSKQATFSFFFWPVLPKSSGGSCCFSLNIVNHSVSQHWSSAFSKCHFITLHPLKSGKDEL